MKRQGFRQNRIEHWQIIAALLLIYDMVAVNAAYLMALSKTKKS